MDTRSGQLPRPEDLIDVEALLSAYAEIAPNPAIPAQRVAFGTSGHRGSALQGSFNEAHIVAMSTAIAEYRADQGIRGPLFIGADTHALSAPAEQTAIDTLVALGVHVMTNAGTGDEAFVPTPALSHAILTHNRGRDARDPELSDGIVITPSHNPPADGGFKYNPPHGGPADGDATGWIADRANELLDTGEWRTMTDSGTPGVQGAYDFLGGYVESLSEVIDLEAIRTSGIRIAAHPLGGASIAYWSAIRDRYDLDLTVLGSGVDPQFAFLHLDWDGKIRMDPSSSQVMSTIDSYRDEFAIVTGNDADADRHGIVTRDSGLMNPNHFLAVAIDYLLEHRPDWSVTAGIGKTLVSSAMIDRVVAAHGRTLAEVPVGFKWFVPGLSAGELVFGGEESAGASFQRFDGSAWSTDKDGILLCLLAAEIQAVTGESPSQRYRKLVARFGEPAYARIDAPATDEQKARLLALSADDVAEGELAGDPITHILTVAPNGAAIGGLKVQTEHAWFAARPSGTEAVMKIYAESFRGPEHLVEVQSAAQALVTRVLG